MNDKLLVIFGVWLFTDALYSILTYPNERFWRNHSFRVIRGLIGIWLVMIG